MKKVLMLLLLALVIPMLSASISMAQTILNAPNGTKITADLQHEMENRPDEKVKVIIVMNEQFDSQKTMQQVQHLGKQQRRDFVVNELHQVSERSQIDVLRDLQQGQKATLVDDIQSYWIINAISCSMTRDMVEAVAKRPDVKYVMKNLVIYVIDGEGEEMTLNDRANNQWNVTKVNADDVWALGYTGEGVIVAVIDTGVNYNHTDIANNMWDGGSSYPYHGWDYVNSDNDPRDDQGHGTHCAGTISSYGTNNKQCGIAKNAKIMALKVLGSNGQGDLNLSWEAIQFAVSHNADVLSMSLGVDGIGGYWVERTVMENVLNCGVVASVAAGNVGESLSTYPIPNNVGSPGNCPPPWHNPDQTLTGGQSATVTVGATTSNDGHSSFSSYGPVTWASGTYIGSYSDYPWTSGSSTEVGLFKPDIAAPGSSIVSLNYSNNTGYTTKSGTSMATPCVAGVMALMLQVNPTLTPLEIDSIIETTAVACGGQTSKNNTFGAGRIDALAAVNYMLDACTAPTNLTAAVSHANVDLNWTAASGVSTYRVYRNGSVIANNIATTRFTDEEAPAGVNTYYVRSNGNNNQASIPSNLVTVTITVNAQANAPTNLVVTNVNADNNTVGLTWTTPEKRSESLYYTLDATIYDGTGSDEIVAAQKFPAATLQAYAGMQIERVCFGIYTSGSECTVSLYEGDALMPGILLHQGTLSTTEAQQWIEYELPSPIVINPDKDLWMTVTTTDYILMNEDYSGDGTGNAFFYSFSSGDYWLSVTDAAWVFILDLNDADYTYNVYNANSVVSTGLNTNQGSATFDEGMNVYQVTAVTNGYESPLSNAVCLFNQNLQSGWNWWTPLLDVNLAHLEAALGSHALLINSQNDGFVECVDGSWSGTLNELVAGQMYKIENSSACNLVTSGTRLTNVEVTLVPGYNWFGCPTTMAVSLADLAITPAEGDTITDASGITATYQSGAWTGTLTTLQPGQGYVYFSNATSNKTLVLP